jgi:hypothetical protein
MGRILHGARAVRCYCASCMMKRRSRPWLTSMGSDVGYTFSGNTIFVFSQLRNRALLHGFDCSRLFLIISNYCTQLFVKCM